MNRSDEMYSRSARTNHARTVSVIVPTYRRPDDLSRCLEALSNQTRSAQEVIVVIRSDDSESTERVKTFSGCLPVRIGLVSRPGVVAALNKGLELAKGEIIAITDDDAAPHADWLERLLAWYDVDPRIGGVGGRDNIYEGLHLVTGAKSVVGKVQRFGRVVGNHHLGVGPARDVDVLKGVNWSFRRHSVSTLRLNENLRGEGAQVHNELEFCLRLRKAGWRLIYDPSIMVDHFPSIRHDDDQRGQFQVKAKQDATFNETVALMAYLSPMQQLIFVVYSITIGTSDMPGLLQALRLVFQRQHHVRERLRTVLRGRLEGFRYWREVIPS